MLNLITLNKLLLIIGGVAWGIYGVFNTNIVKKILPNSTAQKVVYILVGLSALFLMFNRNFYLPFLDKTVLPQSLLKKDNKPDNSTFSIKVKVNPNARIIYWASESNNDKNTPVSVAYGKFKNSGITTADKNGYANLVLRKMSGYSVKKGLFNKKLRPHIHYRYTLPNGLMSEIKTKYVKSKSSKSAKSPKSSKSSKSSRSSKSSKSSRSPRSSKSSKSSKSPRSSRSSSELKKSPFSDLTHIKKCRCPNRHINIHENNCKKQFNNNIAMPSNKSTSTVIPSPNIIKKTENVDKLFNQNQSFEHLFENNQEVNRSLDTILKDRDLNSNINKDKFPQIFYENTNTSESV